MLLSLDEDAGFSQWTVWSPCSRTCNDPASPALKFRTRECVHDRCSGKSRQERVCNLPQCPGTSGLTLYITLIILSIVTIS